VSFSLVLKVVTLNGIMPHYDRCAAFFDEKVCFGACHIRAAEARSIRCLTKM